MLSLERRRRSLISAQGWSLRQPWGNNKKETQNPERVSLLTNPSRVDLYLWGPQTEYYADFCCTSVSGGSFPSSINFLRFRSSLSFWICFHRLSCSISSGVARYLWAEKPGGNRLRELLFRPVITFSSPIRTGLAHFIILKSRSPDNSCCSPRVPGIWEDSKFELIANIRNPW